MESGANQSGVGAAMGGSNTVAAIGLEVPTAQANAVVTAASQNAVYLAQSAV